MSAIQAFPLTWPEMMPRTRAKVTSRFKTLLPAALKNVRGSVNLFATDTNHKVDNLVISSNVTLGVDKPDDTGVAVWFVWDGMQVCIAVDRYPKVEDNLQAIHLIVEARRTELRHGGLNIVRATFRGFLALPGQANNRSWRRVLGVEPSFFTTDTQTINNLYHAAAKKAHPDAGGSNEAMAELNQARADALKELGGQ